MNHVQLMEALGNWVSDHGDKFDSDPVQLCTVDEITTYDADGGRKMHSAEVSFEAAESSLREASPLVDAVVRLLSEQPPSIEGLFSNSVGLIDFNYRKHELPMIVFTVLFEFGED